MFVFVEISVNDKFVTKFDVGILVNKLLFLKLLKLLWFSFKSFLALILYLYFVPFLRFWLTVNDIVELLELFNDGNVCVWSKELFVSDANACSLTPLAISW